MSQTTSISSPPVVTCAICLDDVTSKTESTTLACGHIFHKNCVERLKKCPLDRGEIPSLKKPCNYIPSKKAQCIVMQQMNRQMKAFDALYAPMLKETIKRRYGIVIKDQNT